MKFYYEMAYNVNFNSNKLCKQLKLTLICMMWDGRLELYDIILFSSFKHNVNFKLYLELLASIESVNTKFSTET